MEACCRALQAHFLLQEPSNQGSDSKVRSSKSELYLVLKFGGGRDKLKALFVTDFYD